MRFLSALAFPVLAALPAPAADAKIRVLVIDGQNNHNWQQTTPVLKKILEDTGRFTVGLLDNDRAAHVGAGPHGRQQRYLAQQRHVELGRERRTLSACGADVAGLDHLLQSDSDAVGENRGRRVVGTHGT